jgi:hypothetical protein
MKITDPLAVGLSLAAFRIPVMTPLEVSSLAAKSRTFVLSRTRDYESPREWYRKILRT